jgi:hypothetical protein
VVGSLNIQIPNEIFDDFGQADFKSFNHKCFAYAYYYLVCFLYRNTLYGGNNTEQYSQQNIIKVLTGNKTVVSYITKSDGLLDKLKYTRSTTDYPVSPFMDNGILEFKLIKDLRKRMPNVDLNHSPRFSIKEPIKALTRFDGEDFTGTFYSFQNTHRIDAKRFVNIVTDRLLGHVGLFVYGYISMMCDRFPNGFHLSNTELSRVVGCSERTVQNYTQRLEAIKCIENSRIVLGSKLLEKVYMIR